MSEVLLEAQAVHKNFKKGKMLVPVLKGVDLTIKKGETVSVVGSSGAGKSTLLHILGTLDIPSSGSVYFRGEKISEKSENIKCNFRNRHLGFIFQFHYLLPEFTALENVMMPGLIAGRSESSLKSDARRLLNDVGLAHRENHRPGELSGGESQRVAVARALMMRPEVILGDELTGNLDSQNSETLLSLLLDVNQKYGVSLVLVTHDSKIALKMQRTVVMQDGKLLQKN